MTPLKERIVKEFEEKVNQIRRDLRTDKLYEFGYKYKEGNELFVVTDWGNIKKFLSKALDSYREKTIKEIEEWAYQHSYPVGNTPKCDLQSDDLSDFLDRLKGGEKDDV